MGARQRRSEHPLAALLSELAHILAETSQFHSRLLGHDPHERASIAPKVQASAARCTEVCARIATTLEQSLINPRDAELLYTMALTAADCADSMEHTAHLAAELPVGVLPESVLAAANLIERASERTTEAAWVLLRARRLGTYYTDVRKLSRQGQRLCRQALINTFPTSAMSVNDAALHHVIASIERTCMLFESMARCADLLRVKGA